MNRRSFLSWTAVGAAGLLLPVPKRVATVVFGSGRARPFYRIPLPEYFGAAPQCFTFVLNQDKIRGRPVAWFDGIKWPEGLPPVLTQAAHGLDVVFVRQTGPGMFHGYHGGSFDPNPVLRALWAESLPP